MKIIEGHWEKYKKSASLENLKEMREKINFLISERYKPKYSRVLASLIYRILFPDVDPNSPTFKLIVTTRGLNNLVSFKRFVLDKVRLEELDSLIHNKVIVQDLWQYMLYKLDRKDLRSIAKILQKSIALDDTVGLRHIAKIMLDRRKFLPSYKEKTEAKLWQKIFGNPALREQIELFLRAPETMQALQKEIQAKEQYSSSLPAIDLLEEPMLEVACSEEGDDEVGSLTSKAASSARPACVPRLRL